MSDEDERQIGPGRNLGFNSSPASADEGESVNQGLFDDLLSGEPIFENKEVLRPSYTPHELPHRSDQINKMATILVSALRGETPSNILIYGKTGTGKTASAKFVSQELESTSSKYEVPCDVEYINCEVTDTQYRVLAQLANKFIEENERRIEDRIDRLESIRESILEGAWDETLPTDGSTHAGDRGRTDGNHSTGTDAPAGTDASTGTDAPAGTDASTGTDASSGDRFSPRNSDSPVETKGSKGPKASETEGRTSTHSNSDNLENSGTKPSPQTSSSSRNPPLDHPLADTPFSSLAELEAQIDGLLEDRDAFEEVPMTGWPTDRVYSVFFDAVDYAERVVVIMLDEIDKLVEKSGDDTLYNLSRMNSELENSRVSIIGISNDLKFTDFLDPRVKSSLGEEEIVFPPYDANQLRDILQHRSEIAFEEGALSPDVIPLCAAFAAQEHGDARRALDLLRTAGELAERSQAETVVEDHVRQAQDKIELDRVVEVVRTLPTQSKLVLFAIILLEKNGVRSINTGEVFNIYKQLCEEIDADVLTQRRVTDLISELDMLGIVNAIVVSKGRYGRTKEINLSVPLEETEVVLLSDSRLSEVEEVQPFVQARFDS